MGQPTATVLAVDDEQAILRLVALELRSEGYNVITAASADEALAVLDGLSVDVVLLDLVMPRMGGEEALSAICERRVPVIVISARAQESERQRLLSRGASDYVGKPFGPGVLPAAIAGALRRRASPNADRLACDGGVIIDFGRRVLCCDSGPVELTQTEWQILAHLGTRPGAVVSAADLLAGVWGPEYREELAYLRTWIARLRRKLRPLPGGDSLIETIIGSGYRLRAAPVEAGEVGAVAAQELARSGSN